MLFEQWTKRTLISWCKRNGWRGYGKLNRAELIALCRQQTARLHSAERASVNQKVVVLGNKTFQEASFCRVAGRGKTGELVLLVTHRGRGIKVGAGRTVICRTRPPLS